MPDPKPGAAFVVPQSSGGDTTPGKKWPAYRTVQADEEMQALLANPGICFLGRVMTGALFGCMFGFIGTALATTNRSLYWGCGQVLGIVMGVYAAANSGRSEIDGVDIGHLGGTCVGATGCLLLLAVVSPWMEWEEIIFAIVAATVATLGGNVGRQVYNDWTKPTVVASQHASVV